MDVKSPSPSIPAAATAEPRLIETRAPSRMAGLAELGRAAAAGDRTSFLPLAARRTAELLAAEACEIWLADEAPLLVASYRRPGRASEGAPEEAAIAACLAGGEPVLSPPWHLAPIPGEPLAQGVIGVRRAGAWPEDDLALLQTIAALVDLGLDTGGGGRLDQQSRNQFLALIGHDLRSPLANVRVGAQLAGRNLEAGDLESVRRALAIIESQSHRLIARLEALLDAVAADGQVLVRPEAVDLGALIESALGPYRLAAAESGTGTRFTLTVAPGTPPARCDRVQIGQVIEHLLDNAAKYAAGGLVRIDLRPEGQGLRVEVCDNGPGIRPEDLDRVFAPFGRGQAAAGKEGYGLGLYLARNIVTAHGGRLWIARSSRSGTCMALTLPAAGDPA